MRCLKRSETMRTASSFSKQRRGQQGRTVLSPFVLLAIIVAAGAETIRNGSSNEKKLDEHHRRAQQLNAFTDPKTVDSKPPETEPTNQQQNPNILWLLLDQWRYDWDGLHPDTPTGPLPLEMPFLTKVAEGGTRFTQAYVPSPFCAPSRACVAAGMEYDATGVMKNRIFDGYPLDRTTIYRMLRDDAGYHTMTAGKDDLYHDDPNLPKYPNYIKKLVPKYDLGFSDALRTDGKVMAARNPPEGAPHLFDEPFRVFLDNLTVRTATGEEFIARQAYRACHEGKGPEDGCDASSFIEEIYPDNFVREKAIELLDRKPADKPWFLQVNFPGPHHPIVSNARMAATVMDRTWPLPVNSNDVCPQVELGLTKENMQPMLDGRCNYAAECENLDALMASIVKHIEEMGELDNTIIFISGDHGENLGDNGTPGKGIPWRGSIGTPLFMYGPGVPRGYVHEGPVTTLDVGGTFFDIAGVPEKGPGMTTNSLFSILSPERNLPLRDYVSSGFDNWRVVVKELPTSPEDPTITSYKLICFHNKQCRGVPPTATPYIVGQPWQLMLYDAVRDPMDLVPLEGARPDLVEQMRALLPEGWCTDVIQ